MIRLEPDGAGLPPLSPRQTDEVSRHLRLVQFKLRQECARYGRLARGLHDDLYQEGCMALAEAVRRYDPIQHGEFAPFASIRIRTAMVRFMRERRLLVRVPLATQKRHARTDPNRGTRRVLSLHRGDPREPRSGRRLNRPVIRRPTVLDTVDASLPSLGGLIRERIDAALAFARNEARRAARRPESAGPLIDAVMAERLAVPESSARTPLRAIASGLQLRPNRVTKVEDRLKATAAERLRRDVVFRLLRRIIRRAPDGATERIAGRLRRLVQRAEAISASASAGRRRRRNAARPSGARRGARTAP